MTIFFQFTATRRNCPRLQPRLLVAGCHNPRPESDVCEQTFALETDKAGNTSAESSPQPTGRYFASRDVFADHTLEHLLDRALRPNVATRNQAFRLLARLIPQTPNSGNVLVSQKRYTTGKTGLNRSSHGHPGRPDDWPSADKQRSVHCWMPCHWAMQDRRPVLDAFKKSRRRREAICLWWYHSAYAGRSWGGVFSNNGAKTVRGFRCREASLVRGRHRYVAVFFVGAV